MKKINKEKFLKALDYLEEWEKNRSNADLEETKNVLIRTIREIESPLRESNDKFLEYLTSQGLVFEYLFDEIEELNSKEEIEEKGREIFQRFFNFYCFSLLEDLETLKERQEFEQLISVLEVFQGKKVFPLENLYQENKESIDDNIEILRAKLLSLSISEERKEEMVACSSIKSNKGKGVDNENLDWIDSLSLEELREITKTQLKIIKEKNKEIEKLKEQLTSSQFQIDPK